MVETTHNYIHEACKQYSIVLSEDQFFELAEIVEAARIASNYNNMLITYQEGMNMIIDALNRLHTEKGYKTSNPPHPGSVHFEE